MDMNMNAFSAGNMILDVITTRNPFQYTANFMFVGVRNNKTQRIIRRKINKIRTSVGRNNNLLAKARK